MWGVAGGWSGVRGKGHRVRAHWYTQAHKVLWVAVLVEVLFNK